MLLPSVLMMRLIRNVVSIVTITILFFLVFDFTLSYFDLTPQYLAERRRARRGVAHPVYHHDLKPNLDIIDTFWPIKTRLCTDQSGFKISCNRTKEKRKIFDIAFIGDSFTEAIGVTYEASFVGLYAHEHPDISVANFGVSSYSPSIYLKKIEYLLNNSFTFQQLVVLPDISDIRDEALYYTIDENNGAVIDKHGRSTNEEIKRNAINDQKNNFQRMLIKYFKFTWHINGMIYDYLFVDEIETIKRAINNRDASWTRDSGSPHFGEEGVVGGMRKNLKYMSELKRLLDMHGIKMTLVVYPWPAQLFFEDASHLGIQLWKDFCIKEGCYNFIDANKFFFDEIQKSSKFEVIKKYYIPGDIHFNEEGNKAMFAIIDKHFKQ